MKRPARLIGHDGTASVMALLVATGIFAVTFGVVIQTSLNASKATGSPKSASFEAGADRLAETIFGAGVGWYSSLSCTDGHPDPADMQGDSLGRLGMGREPCPGARNGALDLSFDKLQNLNNGLRDADGANGFVDYAEARESLRLTDEDFHIRSWPVVADVRTMLETGARDPNERVAYIGAYTTLVGGGEQEYQVQMTCGKTDGATSIDLWVDITNNGTTPASFEAEFEIHLEDGDVEFPKHTSVLLPGATTRVIAKVTKTADWDWGANTPKFAVEVSDVVRGLGECEASLAGVTMTAATTTPLIVVHAERLETLLSGGSATPKVYYTQFAGNGVQSAYSAGSLQIQNLLGLPVATDASLHSRGWESFTLTLPLAYQAVLKSALGVEIFRDTLNVLTTTAGSFTPTGPVSGYTPEDGVVPESAYVAALVAAFDPHVYSATYSSLPMTYAAGGDVYPDLKGVLNNDLAGYLTDADGDATLANYNILVVGSDADHNAMTSAAAKQTIRDWVYAGGFLMVMGSEQQAVNWLQPIFHAAISSASSPLVTPDTTHPLLHTPNDLEYQSFDDQGRAWSYNTPETADHFTHVIASGSEDVLAVSTTGVFGKGRVLLTSYEPWDIGGSGATGDCDPAAIVASCQALQLIHNFLTFSYRELYLDYGPPIPSQGHIGAVERIATVWHPELGRQVELVVLVYVF